MLKIIDFEKRGNVVRFYFGDSNCIDYYGDDWDDLPYEHNAGTVYNRYIKECVDVAFSLDYLVLEPRNGTINSIYSKDDMKDGSVPCIIVVPPTLVLDSYWDDAFTRWVGAKGISKFYFEDTMDAFEKNVKATGGVVIDRAVKKEEKGKGD